MAQNNIFSSYGSDVKIKERNILKNVYGWMAAGLGVTGITAFAVAGNPTIMRMLLGNTISLIMLFVVEFGLVIQRTAKKRPRWYRS